MCLESLYLFRGRRGERILSVLVNVRREKFIYFIVIVRLINICKIGLVLFFKNL